MKPSITASLAAILLFCVTALADRASGGEITSGKSYRSAEGLDGSPFVKGVEEAQVLTGPIVSFTKDPHERPAINYVSEDIRLGWMLSTPSSAGGNNWLRGNTEFLLEAFGGEVYQGPGNGLVGGTLGLRYNFVQPKAKIYPYAQIGAGALYNDIYKNREQVLIGEAFEFNLQAGAGLQWMLTRKVALSVEADYRHISNAGLASRNAGLNSVGGLLGVSFFF